MDSCAFCVAHVEVCVNHKVHSEEVEAAHTLLQLVPHTVEAHHDNGAHTRLRITEDSKVNGRIYMSQCSAKASELCVCVCV